MLVDIKHPQISNSTLQEMAKFFAKTSKPRLVEQIKKGTINKKWLEKVR